MSVYLNHCVKHKNDMLVIILKWILLSNVMIYHLFKNTKKQKNHPARIRDSLQRTINISKSYHTIKKGTKQTQIFIEKKIIHWAAHTHLQHTSVKTSTNTTTWQQIVLGQDEKLKQSNKCVFVCTIANKISHTHTHKIQLQCLYIVNCTERWLCAERDEYNAGRHWH